MVREGIARWPKMVQRGHSQTAQEREMAGEDTVMHSRRGRRQERQTAWWERV